MSVPPPAAPQGIALIGPGGETTVASPQDAQTLVALGYQPDTPEVRAAMARQERAASPVEDAKAFAAGAARGATLGLSDLALTKSGAVTPNTLQTLREDHPGSTLAGEFAGVLSPLGAEAVLAKAATGAGRVAAGAARVATAPAAAATKVGEVIERTVASAIANQTASRIAGATARGAAEALAYNVGNNITESALGDTELTAEKLLAHSGEAALLGGGLGFGMSAAFEGARAVFARAKEAGKGASAIAADHYAKAVSTLDGVEYDEAAKLVAKPFDAEAAATRKEIVGKFIGPEERNRIHKALTENLIAVQEGVDEAKRFVNLKRAEETAKLAANVEPAAAVNDLANWIDKVRRTANDMNADPIMHAPVYAKELLAIADDVEGKLTTPGAFESAADIFKLADDIKKTPLADLSEFKRNLDLSDRTVKKSLEQVRGLYNDLKLHLENAANYGEAAARQQGINEAYSTLLELEKTDLKKYLYKQGEQAIDTEKVNRILNRIGSERDRHMVEVLESYQAAATRLADEAEKTAMSTEGAFRADGMRSLIEKTQGLQGEAADKLAATSKIRAQDAFGMALKSWLGDLGLNGGAIGTAANIVGGAASPFTVAKTLSRIESGVLAADRIVDQAVKRFSASGAGSVAKSVAARGASREVSEEFVPPIMRQRVGEDERDKRKDPLQATRQAIDYVTAVAADPMTASDKIRSRLGALQQAAPQTTQNIVNTQLRVAGFLTEKAPKNPFSAYPGIKWSPSDSELMKFQRYVEAASNPLAVLDQMTTGFVTAEAAEAVKSCYPKLFADIQMRFAQRAGEIQKNSTHAQRVALSRVFGVAIDPTAEPKFAAAMQALYAPQEEAPKRPGSLDMSATIEASASGSQARMERQAAR